MNTNYDREYITVSSEMFAKGVNWRKLNRKQKYDLDNLKSLNIINYHAYTDDDLPSYLSVLVSEVYIADAISSVNIYWQRLWYTMHSYCTLIKAE